EAEPAQRSAQRARILGDDRDAHGPVGARPRLREIRAARGGDEEVARCVELRRYRTAAQMRELRAQRQQAVADVVELAIVDQEDPKPVAHVFDPYASPGSSVHPSGN